MVEDEALKLKTTMLEGVVADLKKRLEATQIEEKKTDNSADLEKQVALEKEVASLKQE